MWILGEIVLSIQTNSLYWGLCEFGAKCKLSTQANSLFLGGANHVLEPEKEALILRHIDSIPRANHYRRTHAPNREYICVNGISSIVDMYQLYQRWMCRLHESNEVLELEQNLASLRTYRHIAETRRNIGFSSYGDKCETCDMHEVSGTTSSKAYHRHREVESEARRQHQQFSKMVDDKLHFAVADKGSVKLLPKLNVDFSFYLPRLSLIPMTINAPKSRDSITYWWIETEGGRGPSEILTCMHKYLQSLPSTIRHLRLHFDNCAAENKSQFNVYPFLNWNFPCMCMCLCNRYSCDLFPSNINATLVYITFQLDSLLWICT